MRIRAIVIAGLFALPCAAIAQTSTADQASKIEALFASLTGERPGCVVGITQDGKPVIERAFGLADMERVTANTRSTMFEIGSVSKQFTAAAVLLLERDGKLKLSDDIRTYLPEMPDYGMPITIEMLLNHTSGLRDWGSVANAMGKGRGDRTFNNVEVLDIAARQKELNYKPGAEYSYTNTGYNLAAIVVERVSGKSLMDFTRERLFEPLGMKSVQWRDDYNRIVKNRAMAYTGSGTNFQQSMPFMNVYGNGGLMMTIGDLTRWNEAMMADKLGLRVAMEKNGTLSDGRQIPYARGVNVQPYNGITEVSHSGGTGGYLAWLARYPDKKLSVAMMCNGPPPPTANPAALAGIFLGTAPPAAASVAGLPDPSANAGRFVNTRTGLTLNVTAADGDLRYNGRALPRVSATEWRRGVEAVTFLDADRFRFDMLDGNRFEYVRIQDVTVSTDQLAEYSGVYASDEAMAEYKLAVENGKLTARVTGWPNAVVPLTPSYKDAFTGGGLLVRFRRGADGKIKEMSLGDSRMHDLRVGRVR